MRSLILLLVSASIAVASPEDPTRDELLDTVRHIGRLAQEQQVELDAAHENEKTLDGKLQGTQQDLGRAQSNLIDLQVKIDALAQHDANETAAKKHILTKYHRLKTIACLIAAAVAIFLVMQLTKFIPMAIMPYKIYLYAGAGIVAASLVAIYL